MRARLALPDLLDQGLLIYRRHLTPLLTFSASVMLPITVIGTLLSAGVARSPWGISVRVAAAGRRQIVMDDNLSHAGAALVRFTRQGLKRC